MALDDIKKLNEEINKLRAELGRKSLKPFDENDLERAKSLLSGLRAEVREMGSDLDFVYKSFKDSVNELSKQNTYLSDARKSLNGIADISRKVIDYRRGETDVNEKQLKNLKDQARTRFEELSRIEKIGNLSKINKEEIRKSLLEQDAFNKALDKTIAAQEKVNKDIGLAGTALEGLGKGLEKIGFSNLSQPISKAIQETKNARLQQELNNDAIQDAQNKLEGIKDKRTKEAKLLKDQILFLQNQNQELDSQTSKYKNIGKALLEQVTYANLLDTAITQVLLTLKKSDAETGQLAKAFGTSYSEAASLRGELNTIAGLSGDVNITTSALQTSLIAVNKEFGTSTMFSGELLKDFTNMTKVMGYTDEAAAKLSKITVATGTDLSDNTAQILGTAAAFNVTNDLALNEKEIVEGVAKASAAVTVSLGMQPGRIAAAVVQAKALGLELEQVTGIAESLLNFESSISNELEAELLTGRSLNLEQARYLALTNDIEGVAKEIANQGITAAEFGSMNVIQQKAIAEAVGLTQEELAQSLINQQALTNLGNKDKTIAEAYNRLKKEGLSDAQIQKQLGEDISVQQLKSQSIQERFNATVEKLQDIFATIMEPFIKGLDYAMNGVTKIIGLFTKIGGIAKSFLGDKLGGALGSLATTASVGALMALLGKSLVFLAQSITRGTDMNPTVVRLKGGIPGTGGGSEGGSEGGGEEGMPSFGSKASMGKQLKTLIKNPKVMARALRRSGGGSILKGLTKGGLKGLLKGSSKAIPYLGSLIGAGLEFADGGFNLETAGRAALSGGGAFLGGLAGTAIAPGAGTIAGGIGGSMAGDALANQIFGEKPETAEDFIMRPGQKPLKFKEDDIIIGGTNLFGNTAQSTSPSISVDIAPLVNEMQAVKAVLVQILNKDSNVYMDGAKVGKGINMARTKIG
jgi:hypothetical protein